MVNDRTYGCIRGHLLLGLGGKMDGIVLGGWLTLAQAIRFAF